MPPTTRRRRFSGGSLRGRSNLQSAYDSSLLGGGLTVETVVRGGTGAPMQRFQEGLRRIADLRRHQYVVDSLVRVQHRGSGRGTLCAPHLPTRFSDTLPTNDITSPDIHLRRTSKWHVFRKARLSLAETLAYALRRCGAPDAPLPFKGVLLPFIVSVRRQHDHANMIYLDFRPPRRGRAGHRVRCYLFEPNGAASAERSDGLRRLREAWGWVRRRHVKAGCGHDLDPEARLIGARIDPLDPRTPGMGIQQLLGFHRSLRRHRSTSWQGYGVCGAVTYWLFVTWLWSGTDDSLEQHYVRLRQYVAEDPSRARKQLLEFIHGVNAAMQRDFAAYTRRYVQADIRAVARHIREGDDGPHPASGRRMQYRMRFYSAAVDCVVRGEVVV